MLEQSGDIEIDYENALENIPDICLRVDNMLKDTKVQFGLLEIQD